MEQRCAQGGYGRLQPLLPAIYGVLSVSPSVEDHHELERILNHAARAAYAGMVWQLARAPSVASAMHALTQAEYAAVLCERDLGSGSWKDLIEVTQRLAIPPSLIVTSWHADEYLWVEALNLGAYDVVAKPYAPAEVIRVVNLACLRWRRPAQDVGRPPAGGIACVT